MNKVDWIIHYVIPEEGDLECQANVHTHGLNLHNHPEMMITMALPQEVCASILNNLGLRILEGERFDEEKIYNNILANDMPVKVVKTMVGDNDTAVLLIPDPSRRLPGDEGCEKPYNLQLKFLENIKLQYEE